MKEAIHPEYKAAKIACNCGNVIETRSTRADFHIEICSNCHPFYTGKQKLMDTAGRIEKFKTRYAATQAATAARPEAKAAPAPAASKKADASKENRAAKRAKAGKSKARTEAAPAAPAAAAEGAAKPE